MNLTERKLTEMHKASGMWSCLWNSIVFLLLLGLVVIAPGCRQQEQLEGECIMLTPNPIEFGEIAATGQTVQTDILVSNTSSDVQSYSITSSCGCILSDKPEFQLEPNESRSISLALSSYGRNGQFYSEILVHTGSGTLKVPVKATFNPKIAVRPSRVLLLQDDGGLSGEFKIEAPSSLWSELDFEFDIDDFSLEEIAYDQIKGTKRYRITMQKLKKGLYEPLRLVRKGQESPVLAVPVILGTTGE